MPDMPSYRSESHRHARLALHARQHQLEQTPRQAENLRTKWWTMGEARGFGTVDRTMGLVFHKGEGRGGAEESFRHNAQS